MRRFLQLSRKFASISRPESARGSSASLLCSKRLPSWPCAPSSHLSQGQTDGGGKSDQRRTGGTMGSRDGQSAGKGRAKDSRQHQDQGARPSTRSTRSSSAVKHDKQMCRFVLDLGNNQFARIDYRPAGAGGKIDLYHTEVPPELRGRGIGKALARGALECAARDNIRLKVTCSYLVDYVRRHADEKHRKLIAND